MTSQQFIELLPAIKLLTDGLIFIGGISHVIVTSQFSDLMYKDIENMDLCRESE